MGSLGVINIDGTQGTYGNFFKNVVTSDVVPTKPMNQWHPETMIPSHLDYVHMDRYVPLVLVYRLPDNADATYRSVVDRLKSSLAEILVSYYPMAGRVVKTDDPDHPRQFLCNDRGIPFSEAVLDAKMSSILDLQDFKPIGYLSGFEPAGLDAFKQLQEYPEGGIPLVIAQVTRFNCGGVVVALSWNHLLADMTGAVQFLTAWSQISKTGKATITPHHDRSVLNVQSKHSHSISSNSPAATPPPASPPKISTEEASKIQLVLKTKYTVKTLHVRKEAIVKLKTDAVQEHPELSSMDCLCAHLWRSLARVYAASGVSDVTAFTTAVEGRSRMEVSPSYFGNVVTSAPVMGVPATDILSKPLSYAARMIRKAIQGITKKTYWTIINEMDLRNPWKTSINRTDYQLGLTSWVRFGLNEIDFGFGRPIYIGPNLLAQNSRKGQCLVLPSAVVEGDYFVVLFLAPKTIEALWADPEFTSIS